MKAGWAKLLVGAGVLGVAGGGVLVGTKLSKSELEIAAPKKQALKAELTQLKRDQKERARQVAKVAQSPQVRKHPEVLAAAKELGAKQAEVALLMERTERLMSTNDPKARAYEQALGRSLAEADRSAHALNQVAYRKGLAPKPRPQWVPGRGAQQPMTPKQAAALGVVVGIGATLVALDLAYDWSRYAYSSFDRSWDTAYYSVPASTWVACDVYAEIDDMPRAEMAYVFQNYFTAYDYSFYAESMHVQSFSETELTTWASAEYYDPGFQSPELAPDWTEAEEVAALEHQYGVEPELADAATYEQDWQVSEADAERFEQPEDLYPGDTDYTSETDVALERHGEQPSREEPAQDEPANEEQQPQEEPASEDQPAEEDPQ